MFRGSARTHHRSGFTMTEIMVVVGLIIVILAILLPALQGVRSQALMSASLSNMRQIHTWMQLYSTDNREIIVPSQFDYSTSTFPGKVRSQATSGFGGNGAHKGTWADILWAENKVAVFPEAIDLGLSHDYAYQVPDAELYEALGTIKNPFRSAAKNSKNMLGLSADSLPKPYGQGALEAGLPGFFAANNFFNATPSPDHPAGNWVVTGQIRAPDRSMYLVDSFVGMTIAPLPGPWDNTNNAVNRTIEVDFRYSGSALMLFLDGSASPIGMWETLADVEGRGIRITDPTAR